MFKKFFAVLLCFCFIFSGIPEISMPVYADTTSKKDEAAIGKIQSTTVTVDMIYTGSKKLTVTYGKIPIKGVKYQVDVRKTNEKWGAYRYVTPKTTYTVKKLNGKHYEVRVRAMQTISGEDYYGKWSKIIEATLESGNDDEDSSGYGGGGGEDSYSGEDDEDYDDYDDSSYAQPSVADKNGSWSYRGSSKYAYKYSDGTYPYGVVKISDEVYFFKSQGVLYRSSGQHIVSFGGKKYDVGPSGALRYGWQVVNDSLYYFSKVRMHAMKAGRKVGKITLAGTGKAVPTLDAVLKKKSIQILEEITSRSADRGTQLRAVYNYMVSKNNFSYSSSYYPNLSSKSWVKTTANRMMDSSAGNCYGFASMFAALAYEIGYHPAVLCGRVPGGRDRASDGYTRHAMVRIDGLYYDPEAEFAGWKKGIYGKSSYPISFRSGKSYSFSSSDGSGMVGSDTSYQSEDDFEDFGAAVPNTYRVVKRGERYYGYYGEKLLAAGVYYINGKLYKFGSGHYTDKATTKALKKAAKTDRPWQKLRSLIGAPNKSQSMGESCYGDENGADYLYIYRNFTVSTFRPEKGKEIIEGITERK